MPVRLRCSLCVHRRETNHVVARSLPCPWTLAAFRAEAIRLGVSEAHVDSLIAKGIRSFSLFAFISSYQPGAADEKPFVDALVAKLGEEARECLPSFRHLFYTSHTLAVQELKDKFEPREEAKRLSMADRVDRLERLRKSLPGMTIDTWLEPSHALVDKAVSFAEEQCLGPLELSKCTSREVEMRSEKRDPVTFKLEQLNIKVTKNHAAVTADTIALTFTFGRACSAAPSLSTWRALQRSRCWTKSSPASSAT